MPGFYYFVPRDDVVNEREGRVRVEQFKDTPLEHLFVGREKSPDEVVAHVGPGPDDKHGTLLYPRPPLEEDLPRCFYLEAKQDWRPFEGYYVGRDVDQPMPTPTSFMKAQGYGGTFALDCAGSAVGTPRLLRPYD